MKAFENVDALSVSPKTREYSYAADGKDSFVIQRVVNYLGS